MTKEDHDWWFKRGLEDAGKGKPPIFRTKRGITYAVGEEWNNEDVTESEAGAAYLAGYEKGESL